MYCLYCGNKLLENAIFCNRCGKRQREEENESTSGDIIQPGPPLPGTFIGGGQPSLGNVPMVQGTPQASTAPTLQGTPANLNTPPGGQVLSHHMAPSSSPLSAPSQAPIPPVEPEPSPHHPHPEDRRLRSGGQTLAGHVTRRRSDDRSYCGRWAY
jgi:hypothetical protein